MAPQPSNGLAAGSSVAGQPSGGSDYPDPLFRVSPQPGAAFAAAAPIPAHPTPFLAPAGTPADDQGRGWGIREGRKPTSAWVPDPSAPVMPLPGYAPAYPMMPGTAVAPWQAPAGSGPGVLGRLALLLIPLLAVGAGLLFLRYQGTGSRTHTISLPSSIGGVLQNNDAQFAALANQLKSTAGGAPGVKQAEIGFYGQQAGGLPEFEVALASADRGLSHSDVDQFVTGFNAASGANFSLSNATTTTDQGVDFICGPFSLRGQSGNVCVWVDGNVLGAVVGFPGVDAGGTLAEAQAARSGAEH